MECACRNSSDDALAALAKMDSFDSLMAVSFLFGQEWWGRIFPLDPQMAGPREELRFLQDWCGKWGRRL